MKTIIVLAMHGAPANDFPRRELGEFFELHGRMETSPAPHDPAMIRRHGELDGMVKRWPRTPRTDPYHAASLELAGALENETGLSVIVGFNEFCAPDLDEALDRAAGDGAERILVLTAMLTRGGEHAERDIALAVERARGRHPGIEIIYAWPFETRAIARFLADQARRFAPGERAD